MFFDYTKPVRNNRQTHKQLLKLKLKHKLKDLKQQ